MKKNAKIFFPVIALLCAFAFKAADDIITRLGMRHAEAKKYIMGNLLADFSYLETNGNVFGDFDHFKIPTAKLLPSIVKGDKVGAAKELCAYVKMYCNSEDFINEYNQYRNMFKPKAAPPKDANVTNANANLLKIYKDQIAMYEEYLAKAKKAKDTKSIALYEKGLSDLRKQVAELEDPNPERTAWEKKYPVEPSPYVKARLEEYLSLVATVDFAATLTPKGDKMIFVNPVYEKKNVKWKAIYRAGKEVNDAVTAFVKEWLKGEIISAVKTKMPADANEGKKLNNAASNNTIENSKSEPALDSTGTKKKKIGGGLRNKVNGIIGKNL